MCAKQNAPVIIKRKKIIAGGGHHGGAWKVAYADFVTAMMAFFMLMWLLNATTEKQRKGIADYFSPTIPIMRISGGGDGSFGGDSVFSEDTLAQNGTGASMRSATMSNQARGSSGADPDAAARASDAAGLESVQESLTAMSGESMVSPQTLRHILTRVTDEGLIVELFASAEEPLFAEKTDQPTQLMIDLSAIVARVFGLVGNEVAINGFSRTHPIVLRVDPVWDLSASRADAVRKLVQGQGLEPLRIQRVTGFANRKPAARNPMAPRNDRIELILLRDKTLR